MSIPLPAEGLPPPSPKVLRRHDENVRQGLVDIEMRAAPAAEEPAQLGDVAGLYERDCGDGEGPAECGGRPTYTKSDGSGLRLFYSEASSHWFVGDQIGRASGVACARGDCTTPDQLHADAWEVNRGGWRPAKGLQAHCVIAAPVMYHLA
jgi:hypothetical protein